MIVDARGRESSRLLGSLLRAYASAHLVCLSYRPGMDKRHKSPTHAMDDWHYISIGRVRKVRETDVGTYGLMA